MCQQFLEKVFCFRFYENKKLKTFMLGAWVGGHLKIKSKQLMLFEMI